MWENLIVYWGSVPRFMVLVGWLQFCVEIARNLLDSFIYIKKVGTSNRLINWITKDGVFSTTQNELVSLP